MKKILEKGIFFAVVAIALVLASFIFLIVAAGLLLTAVGNLAFWPAIGSMIIGKPITIEQSLAIGAVMLIVIILGFKFFSHQTQNFLETFAFIWVWGLMALFWLLLLGAPGFVILKNGFEIDLPGWAVLPIGVATIFLILLVSWIARWEPTSGKPRV